MCDGVPSVPESVRKESGSEPAGTFPHGVCSSCALTSCTGFSRWVLACDLREKLHPSLLKLLLLLPTFYHSSTGASQSSEEESRGAGEDASVDKALSPVCPSVTTGWGGCRKAGLSGLLLWSGRVLAAANVEKQPGPADTPAAATCMLTHVCPLWLLLFDVIRG